MSTTTDQIRFFASYPILHKANLTNAKLADVKILTAAPTLLRGKLGLLDLAARVLPFEGQNMQSGPYEIFVKN